MADIQEQVFRIQELAELQDRARLLWGRILRGEDTPALRVQVNRLEALQAALLGMSEAVAACHGCGRMPERHTGETVHRAGAKWTDHEREALRNGGAPLSRQRQRRRLVRRR